MQSMKLLQKGIKILKEQGARKFFQKLLNFVKDRLHFLLRPYFFLKRNSFITEIKKFKPNSLEELIHFSFNGVAGLIRPMQIQEEILELLKILEKNNPKIILEIGTANGGTLFLFSRIASDDATIISVDLPQGKFGGGYPKWKIPLYEAFAQSNQKLHLIRADSHKQETLEEVEKFLNGRKIDFLFIDGDHAYEGVKKDFEMYHKLVIEGGIIAFHDIVPGPAESVGGVPKFWGEAKGNAPYKEIVHNWNQGGYGIGVLFL